jgi:hypothetical protein
VKPRTSARGLPIVNLLPDDYRKQRRFFERTIYQYVASVVFIIFLAYSAIVSGRNASVAAEVAAKHESAADGVTTQKAELDGVNAAAAKLLTEIRLVDGVVGPSPRFLEVARGVKDAVARTPGKLVIRTLSQGEINTAKRSSGGSGRRPPGGGGGAATPTGPPADMQLRLFVPQQGEVGGAGGETETSVVEAFMDEVRKITGVKDAQLAAYPGSEIPKEEGAEHLVTVTFEPRHAPLPEPTPTEEADPRRRPGR